MIVYTKKVQNIVKKAHKPEGEFTMEIERKFLVKQIPEGCTSFPCRQIEQAYLNTDPVVRIRRDNDDYYLTYKGKGLLSREEYNLALNKEAYEHLIKKADGNIITKKRYEIPDGNGYTIELDIFEGLLLALSLQKLNFQLSKLLIHTLSLHGLLMMLLMILLIITVI